MCVKASERWKTAQRFCEKVKDEFGMKETLAKPTELSEGHTWDRFKLNKPVTWIFPPPEKNKQTQTFSVFPPYHGHNNYWILPVLFC